MQQKESGEDEVFFAGVFLGKAYKKLFRCGDKREERKPASLSSGFVPGPALSFILLKGRSAFWQKQYICAPLTRFLAILDFWNTTVFLEINGKGI